MKKNLRKYLKPLLPAILLSATVHAQTKTTPAKPELVYHDAMEFPVIDKYHNEPNYNRMPEKFKATVRPIIWSLSLNSAGIAIRFRSNANTIGAKWKAKNNAALNNMSPIGVKGLDLYALVNNQWQFVNSGVPEGNGGSFQRNILTNGENVAREYLLFLPLYDGVDSLSIGVNAGAEITKPQTTTLLDKKPIAWYGSSIAQGASASRPGMAFTNILVRKLQRPVINFGFSGNGTFETTVGESLCEMDAALFVIDCNPNTQPEEIYDRSVKLVQQIRKCRPNAPILLVENFIYESGYFNPIVKQTSLKKQAELKKAFAELQKQGIKNLFYQTGAGLIGNDHEGTVDGVHPNDVGMERFAAQMLPILDKLTKGKP
ncbi:SGNH/GDSL hydrolase family protein [Chitinophaga sp. sic0106]|uniref:SGNH/GDSL hydrolase family protein n=1 Tax=Chitinophaga sp. sic0106 TaxID=2854785 RepID=UPI001C484584|nr:SGNH/GDSL hydrolase family protein [Chitinophaga sp. sic0106]MBV7532587.1 SGNH/GDSL hydrolase family protein [Chitinophaga sp. sic0106]